MKNSQNDAIYEETKGISPFGSQQSENGSPDSPNQNLQLYFQDTKKSMMNVKEMNDNSPSPDLHDELIEFSLNDTNETYKGSKIELTELLESNETENDLNKTLKRNRRQGGTPPAKDELGFNESNKFHEHHNARAKIADYDANEIIEELSDESNFMESPNRDIYRDLKITSLLQSHRNSEMPMRPYLKQLLKDVINSDFLYYIADFLTTKTIIMLTGVNTMFRDSFKIYLPTRLQQEADYINLFIETNDELNKEFMKLVDTQIPISNGNWLNFDFINTLKIISHGFANKDISDLKFTVNNTVESNDILFAPFCILFSQKCKRSK